MYRIAETIRVLLFMTLAIMIFNFYPVTAVMIVMLALLNDGAILSIAYDNVHYKDAPEAWNMRLVLGISTVMGLFGVAAAFGLFFLGDRVFHLDHAHVQTLMYLKLSVAGHLTIFLTRTRGPFWSIRPARILLIAVFGTQAIATLIAVYGLFMTPLGWGWAGFVWGYALIWFLVTDRVKLLAYRVLDHIKAETKTETTMSSETKDAPKPDAKTESDAKPTLEAHAVPVPKADVAGLFDMKLGDVLLAGLVRDPESIAHLVSQAVENAEAPRSDTGTKSDVKPEPVTNAETEPEAKPETAARKPPAAKAGE
jgi:H+-transporting ATPase